MEELIQRLKEQIIEALNLEDITPDDIDNDAPLFGEGLGLDSIDAVVPEISTTLFPSRRDVPTCERASLIAMAPISDVLLAKVDSSKPRIRFIWLFDN